MFKSLVFISLLALSLCSQTIPLPKTLDGLSLGSETTSFTLEAHYDLLCPDSRDSYFVLSQVIRDFNLSSNPNFKFTIHFFPLPYHTYAHRAAIVERCHINFFLNDLKFLLFIDSFKMFTAHKRHGYTLIGSSITRKRSIMGISAIPHFMKLI